MEIERPATDGDGIGVLALLDHVLLDEDVIALEAAALAFARDGADPFESHCFGLRELAGILDIVPDAVDHLPEFPLDLLGVVDGVAASAVFDPPEVAAAVLYIDIAVTGDRGDVLECVVGGDVVDWLTGVFAVKENGVAEQLAVTIGRSEALAELVWFLGSHAEGGTGLEGDDAVTRGVAEERCLEHVAGGVLAAEGVDA